MGGHIFHLIDHRVPVEIPVPVMLSRRHDICNSSKGYNIRELQHKWVPDDDFGMALKDHHYKSHKRYVITEFFKLRNKCSSNPDWLYEILAYSLPLSKDMVDKIECQQWPEKVCAMAINLRLPRLINRTGVFAPFLPVRADARYSSFGLHRDH